MINKTVEKLPIDVEKNIRSRVSIRNYEDKNLTPEDKRKLMDFNETLTNPFGVPVKIQYLSTGSGAQNVKLGTYGTIKGARDYLAITVKDEYGLLQLSAEKILRMPWIFQIRIYFHA